ncbi:MAG: 3-dehydroquinate synthase [Bacteroidales bacterium]|nr:3-dehydroquinate synthase [Bacteroidales bacterium]
MPFTSLIFTENIKADLEKVLSGYAPNQVYILSDAHTESLCLPALDGMKCLAEARHISIPAGDEHKDIDNLARVWQFLSQEGATRKSILVNIGGGMVTDLGGFAAATFKRGIACVHIPTTVLAAVDASVGGKTGINFNGLKNEIGAFHLPIAVLFYAPFFKSLDRQNLLSGYAEMLKHGLLSNITYWHELLSLNLAHPESPAFLAAVKNSVHIKENITEQDPREQGIRKALNLGHTVGHAFESLSHKRGEPVLHGYAIAWGLICELYLSSKFLDFPKEILQLCVQFVREEYGVFYIDCKDYPALYESMTHDKKNESKAINFTLLSNIGEICLDQTANQAQIEQMFDFYRDSMGI